MRSLLWGVNVEWPKDKLTRFEVARLIGARSLQIALGAPILISTKESNSIKIAEEEFKQKIIPITAKRKLPDESEVLVDVKTGIDNWIVEHKGEI